MDLHDTNDLELLNAKKVPKYAYDVMMETVLPLKRYAFWQKSIPDIPMNVDWMEVHTCNYNSCIATRFRSFFSQCHCIEQFFVQDLFVCI